MIPVASDMHLLGRRCAAGCLPFWFAVGGRRAYAGAQRVRTPAGEAPRSRRIGAEVEIGVGPRNGPHQAGAIMAQPTPLQPQLRLRRPLEAPLPPERPLPQGFRVRPYACGDEAAWARLLHDNGELGDWDEARVRDMIARVEPKLLLDGAFFVERDQGLVATGCTMRHHSTAPGRRRRTARELLEIGWVGVAPSARGHGLAYIVSRHILAYWQPRTAGDVFILTDDWRMPAIVTYLRLGFRPEIVHPNQVERWRALAQGFEGELRAWAMPPDKR
jgi:mycothiol synthase